ncbi:MAG: DNA/RNA nuclease SfsA [Alphaproteobacteria bacterium]|nr:DNA/RNA nuclease SfsA [Alphaproteobacteria bacterium]
MKFPLPLQPARLVRRYKRFLSDHALPDGRIVVAHCPNPGSMLGLDAPGSETWLSPAPYPERKLAFTWEMIRVGRGLVGIHTGHPNALVTEGIVSGRIPELTGYATLKREVRYGVNSRIDVLLTDGERPPCYVEVKNVHLKRKPGLAEFPDCVTARGAKHLAELGRVVAAGGRAVMLYLVQRRDCRSFQIAADIDPGYAEALALARAAGVETLCYQCNVNHRAITLDRPLPMNP